METQDIVIEVRGGMVAEVYSDIPNLSVVLVDWDNIKCGDEAVLWPAAGKSSLPDETREHYERALVE